MKKQFLLASFMFALCHGAFSQSIEARVKKNIVNVAGNKMTATDYMKIEKEDGSTYLLKLYGESPATGVMSRDYFASVFSTFSFLLLQEMTKGEGDSAEPVDKPEKEPDMYMDMQFSQSGIRLKSHANGSVIDDRSVPWSELYK